MAISKKLLALTLVAVIAMTTLTSCGTKGPSAAQLQSENNTMLTMLKDNETKIKSLEDTIKSLTGSSDVPEAISNISNESTDKTFNTIKSKIYLPVAVKYPNSTQAPNNSSVNLAGNVLITPSNNWTIKINGTETEFTHPDGLYGTIKIGSIIEATDAKTLNDTVFKPILEAIPNKNPVYQPVFIDNFQWGSMVSLETTIDSKPATLKMMTLGIGNVSLTSAFYYNEVGNTTKEELVTNLLKTLKINQLPISFN